MKLVVGTTLTEQYVYQVQNQIVVVDNGTGSSTTNLTGFQAFERAMLSNIFQTFEMIFQLFTTWVTVYWCCMSRFSY